MVYGTVAGIPAQQPKPQAPPRAEPQQQQQQQQQNNGGEGRVQGDAVPPTYDQAIAGDNKVQR